MLIRRILVAALLVLATVAIAQQAAPTAVESPATEDVKHRVLVDGVPLPKSYERLDTAKAAAIAAKRNSPSANVTIESTTIFRVELKDLPPAPKPPAGRPVDPPAPPAIPKPGELANGLQVVTPDEWQPRNVKHVTNPSPQQHPEFTAALQSPKLWWADSLRPYPGDQDALDNYYGARMHGGPPTQVGNPYVSYDAEKDATKQLFFKDQKGIPISYNTRLRWTPLTPDNAKMASVQWEYRIGPNGPKGGKQIQIAGGPKERLHFELNMYGGYGRYGDAGNWGRLPVARVYFAPKDTILGNYADTLVKPCSDPSKSKCPAQPNLGNASIRNTLNPEDHVSLGGNQYLLGDESLSGWATITVTFDWRDPNNHLVWMHVKDERTPRTLVIGHEDGGYPLRYQDGEHAVRAFWLEFNNSKTINDTDSHVWVRNLVVMKDQFAFEPAADDKPTRQARSVLQAEDTPYTLAP